MPRNIFVGEFEQLILLTLLRLGEGAYALPLRDELSRVANRPISRGALYRTLDRLDQKAYVAWELEDGVPNRGGHPRRRFRVTPRGIEALRASRQTLLHLWQGLEEALQ
jgi:DNA-binding PadR family transcriptional regulator